MTLDIVAVLVDPETAPFCLTAAAAAATIDPASRIEGFHARLKPESAIMPTEEVLTPARRKKLEAAAAARSAALRQALDTWAAGARSRGVQVDWQEVVVDNVEAAVAARGRRADLLALVRPGDPEGNAALHAAIFDTGRPLLLLPRTSACQTFGKHLAIAWKASGPAERAVAAALPWLRRAERISVLMVGAAAGDQGGPPRELAALLEGHGPPPVAVDLQQGDMSVGERLSQAAREIGADGLVLGAYRHHRLMEMILGGVTRELLRHSDLPLFLMH